MIVVGGVAAEWGRPTLFRYLKRDLVGVKRDLVAAERGRPTLFRYLFPPPHVFF